MRSTVHVMAMGGGWVNAEAAASGFHWDDKQRWCSERRSGRWFAHDVHVLPAARIEGRVLRADGSPALGALVRPIEQEIDPATKPASFPWTAVPEARCDEDGRFRLDGLPLATTLLLGTQHVDHGEAYAGPVDLAPGKTATVEIRFPSTRAVQIQVVDVAGGTPVEGARVIASWPLVGSKPRPPTRRGTRTAVVRSGTSDVRGMVRLPGLPESAVQLTATAQDYLPLRSRSNAWENVLEGWTNPRDPVRIVLQRGAWIAGRVALPDHVRGLQLTCKSLDASEFAGFETTTSVKRDGTFRVLAPPRGQVRLSAYGHNYTWTVDGSIEVEAGDTDVLFSPEIRGQQRPPPDTRPRWSVRVLGPDGERVRWVSVNSAGDGSALQRIARGTQSIDCRVEGIARPGGTGVWLSLAHGVTLDDVRLGGLVCGPFDLRGGEAEVRLPAAHSVVGRVIDAQGRPVQGAHVAVTPDAPPGWSDVQDADDWTKWCGAHGRAHTDAHGRFDVQGLGGGGYAVSVRAMGALRPPTSVHVQVPTGGVTLRMIAAVTHNVTFLGADGEPIADATVQVGQTDGVQGPSDGSLVRGFTTDAAGVVVITDLEPGGTYCLSLRDAHPYTERSLGRTIRSAWKPSNDVIRLDVRHAVRGVVVDAAGEPVPRACVYMKDATGDVEMEETEDDGAFLFGGVEPGVVRLAAVFQRGLLDWNPPAAFPVEFQAGNTNVVIKIVSRRDLLVTCDASSAPEQMPTSWYLVALDGREEPETHSAKAYSRGPSVRFRDLEPRGRYRLWAGPSEDGWYLLADVGPEATTARVVLRQGTTLKGRLLLPPGTVGARVEVTDTGVLLRATARVKDGAWELRGVPEGTWSLEASCSVGDQTRSVVVRVRPGDAPEIDLTKE